MLESKIQNPKSKISLVAAMSENRVIGRNKKLPWHMPGDLAYFKRLTTGHVVVMGRRTFESMDGPLPHRRHIVITRQRNYRPNGAHVAHDLNQALQLAPDEDEIFILGGGEIFQLAMPRADRLHLTIIHAVIEGDTFFPEFDPDQWTLVHDEPHQADHKNPYDYSFRRYERVAKKKLTTEAQRYREKIEF